MKVGITAALILLCASVAGASKTKIWVSGSAADFSAGTAHGVSSAPSGRLFLSRRGEKVAGLDDITILSVLEESDGTLVLGTGDDGKILVQRAGSPATLLAKVPETLVTALARGRDGSLFAGTSPNGRVYRIENGVANPYFDPEGQYIWALEAGHGPELFAATGVPGRIYRITGPDRGEVYFDPRDEHVRCLLLDGRGRLWAGTSGRGLLLRVDARGRAATVYDSQKVEVAALAAGNDGDVFAAAVASRMPVPRSAPVHPAGAAGTENEKKPETKGPGDDGEPTVTISVSTSPAPSAPPAAASAPKGALASEIIRVSPDGRVSPYWSSSEDLVYSLEFESARNGLLAGTGPKGKLLFINALGSSLEESYEEKRIPFVCRDAVVADSPSAAYRMASAHRGEYFSAIKDTGRESRFGAFRREARIPRGASLSIAFRSGNSAVPDPTWSPWSESVGEESLSAIPAPPGRFLQWKAVFEAAGAVPELSRVECAFQNVNTAPEIESFAAVAVGPWEGLSAPASDSSDLGAGSETIFSAGDSKPSLSRSSRSASPGQMTLAWKSSDPDGDDVVADIEFRPEGSKAWIPLRRNLRGSAFTFDSDLLPGGRYRFRLTVSDRDANPDEARSVSRESEPVLVDNTPPDIELAEPASGSRSLRIRVHDAASPISTVAWSLSARPWKLLAADDGMSDSQEESYTIPIGPESRGEYVLIRAVDAAGNASSRSFVAP